MNLASTSTSFLVFFLTDKKLNFQGILSCLFIILKVNYCFERDFFALTLPDEKCQLSRKFLKITRNVPRVRLLLWHDTFEKGFPKRFPLYKDKVKVIRVKCKILFFKNLTTGINFGDVSTYSSILVPLWVVQFLLENRMPNAGDVYTRFSWA